jgi:hypothetical protein
LLPARIGSSSQRWTAADRIEFVRTQDWTRNLYRGVDPGRRGRGSTRTGGGDQCRRFRGQQGQGAEGLRISPRSGRALRSSEPDSGARGYLCTCCLFSSQHALSTPILRPGAYSFQRPAPWVDQGTGVRRNEAREIKNEAIDENPEAEQAKSNRFGKCQNVSRSQKRARQICAHVLRFGPVRRAGQKKIIRSSHSL